MSLDRTGVCASVLCAIHCAAAPALMLAAPALGGLWSHPISHVAVGAVVLPVALLAIGRGFRAHGRRWILSLGVAGVGLVIAGAVLPYFGGPAEVAGCADSCCPSFVVDEASGARTLSIPPASVVSLLGGLSLVVAHMANLRSCACCARRSPAA